MDRPAPRIAAAAAALLASLLCMLIPGSAFADPAVWRVTNGTGGEMWLLGSVHYLREQDYPLPAVIDELYENADALVMELDLDDLDSLQAQSAFLSAAMLPGDTRLSNEIAADVYRLAEQRAREFGFELRLLEQFEPWLVAVTMLERGMAQRDFSPEKGLEQYLLGRASADGKEVLGLESLTTQIAVFDDLSPADQESLLEQTLQELESPDDVIGRMIDSWREGRTDALAEELVAEFEEFPALYDSLVVERNEAWIDELERLLGEPERHLVVVGALHLVGEDSVVDLLRRRGLTVE